MQVVAALGLGPVVGPVVLLRLAFSAVQHIVQSSIRLLQHLLPVVLFVAWRILQE